MKIKQTLTVRCIQHPNGDAWVTAEKPSRDHWKVLAEKTVEVEFDVELGYDPERSYPEGRISGGAEIIK